MSERRTKRGQLRRPEQPGPRPRLLGPAFLLMAAVAVAVAIKERPWERASPAPRPVGQAVPQSLATPEMGITPEPGWWLRRADEIELTAAQRQQVRALATQWDKETAADRAALESAAAELSGYLSRRQAAGAFDAAAANDRGRPYSELSAGLAATGQDYWERAWALLSVAQQDKVRALRRAAPLEMR